LQKLKNLKNVLDIAAMAAAVIRGHHENDVARVGRTDQFAFQTSIQRIPPHVAPAQVVLPVLRRRSAARRRMVKRHGPAGPLSRVFTRSFHPLPSQFDPPDPIDFDRASAEHINVEAA